MHVTLPREVNRRVSLKPGARFVWLAAVGRTPPGVTEADCGGATTRRVLLHNFKLKVTWIQRLLREKEARNAVTFIRGQ